jgi:hypothetical protein
MTTYHHPSFMVSWWVLVHLWLRVKTLFVHHEVENSVSKTSAQYVTLQKSKSSYYLFFHPLNTLIRLNKTGTANRLKITNSNPPGSIKLSTQLTAGVRLRCAFHQPQLLWKNARPEPFCWAKLPYFDFSCSDNLVSVNSEHYKYLL